MNNKKEKKRAQLHNTKWSDGNKKKGWKPLSSKKNSIQDSVGNEQNGYPFSDSNKTKINVTKKPSDIHRNNLHEHIFLNDSVF
jgi:hypothetical protein